MGIILIIAALLSTQPEHRSVVRVTPVTVIDASDVPALDPIGTCEGGGRSYDLRRMLRLQNRSIDIDGPNGVLRVSIEKEMVNIQSVERSRARDVYGTNIGYQVRPDRDLDVELTLGYLNSELVLYWKETFQNRIYEQGIFRINRERIEFLCSGRGGIASVE